MIKKLTPEEKALKASIYKRIDLILQPYYQFRLYVKFNNDETKTLYGREENCTYEQCIHLHTDKINLSRLKGYTELLNYVEKTKKGQYKKAIIYMREPGAEKFNTVCRRYYNGQIEEINDPVLNDDDFLILDYQIINGRVVIKTPGSAAEDLPDFKTEVNKSLNK